MKNTLYQEGRVKMDKPYRNVAKIDIMNSLKKVDVLFFIFFMVTTILLLAGGTEVSGRSGLLLVRGGIFIAATMLIYLDAVKKLPLLHLFRNTYPIVFSGYFYSETVHYNKIFFDNIDPWLIDLESQLFGGVQPSIQFSAHFSNAFFSELMYFGYFSFYLLILGFTLYVFFKEKTFSNKGIFLLSSSLYLFYFFFGLVPSEGPQFYFSPPESILPDAHLFDKVMHFIQKTAEEPTGAFPSSHVGISLIILMLSKKRMPLFFMMALPLTVILILSTVYIKAHYVIDVLGAIVVAPFVVYLSNALYKVSIKK